MESKIAQITENIIGILYNDGKGKTAELAALRSTKVITDRYARKVIPLLASYSYGDLVLDNGEINPKILAIYNALKLYAIHQQGQTNNDGNLRLVYASEKTSGQNLIALLGQLRKDEEVRNGLDRQVNRLLAAPNLDFMMNVLIRLIKILKSKNKIDSIDYGRLAADLYIFQKGIDAASGVRFRWGALYYQNFNKNTNEEGVN